VVFSKKKKQQQILFFLLVFYFQQQGYNISINKTFSEKKESIEITFLD